ncbi:putative fatty-acid--CoA ligase [Gordonia hirsuta DSM 44140 = NBRC 16056]|uniref:Putative fatty-acid--CoA ligase n=1 Tax=Gordonia hirsuta DSM 44140 = NBRC 16056 TaxID=1121927 RepID=L7LCF4_9ACTN|nr:long-chain-fatty-acid--CoA ligase [Gordonia hirsuta]GAC58579.1 putative fatty-acid--CoA ligase [Gordonia hirsuta DSM 44140 = NBRC 16056]
MTANISAALDRAVALFGDETAMVDGDHRWTYRDLDARVRSFDAALGEAGLIAGDVVGVLALNSRAHLVAWLGVPRSGRVLNEINTRLSETEIAYIIDDSATRLLLVDDAFLETGRALRTRCPSLDTLIYCGGGTAPEDCLDFEVFTTSGRSPQPVIVGGDDVAGIFYTGGTTGRPKGVLLSHDNLIANAKHALICLRYTHHDTYLHAGPMFHLADGASTVALTWVGGTHVIIGGFDRELWLETVEREGVTRAMLVPTMLTMLLSEPLGDRDLSTLQSVLYGASPMPTALLRTAIQTLGCDFCQVYGMTEAAPIVTFLTHEDHRDGIAATSPEAQARLRSAGRPIVGVDVVIRDPQGSPLPTGDVGEITVRGMNVMQGYLNKPDETADVLIDGWFHTGDMGYLDGSGYLYVVDRLKDMIITGGENVYSTEVENALYRHPDVIEVAVFGTPDPRWGEAVTAAVVLRRDGDELVEELRDHCRDLIAGYKVPRVIHIVDEALPKSGAGKILKRNLRDRYSPAGQLR